MTKLAHMRKYDVTLLWSNTNMDNIKNESKELPTDVHLVTYVDHDDDNRVKMDAVRSYKMTDVFDAYYDYGYKDVKSITSGYGSISPRRYTPKKGEGQEDEDDE